MRITQSKNGGLRVHEKALLQAQSFYLFAFVIGMFLAFLAKRAGTRAVTGGTSPNPPNDRNVRGYHSNTTR